MSQSMEDFFTSGRRIKKEVPKSTPPKTSPSRKEKTEDYVEAFKKGSSSKTESSYHESSEKAFEAKRRENEERKRYPERTFDRYVQKGARLRAEDIDLLKVFCSEITRAKRDMPYEYRSNKRITDNTVLRILLQEFCKRIEDRIDDVDFKGIQSESELRMFIEETMKF